jgi:hypothetical protein
VVRGYPPSRQVCCAYNKKGGLTGAPTAITRTTSTPCLTLFLCPKAYGLFCSQASAEPTAHILGWNYGSADIDAPSPPAAGNRPTRHLAPFAAKANTVTAVANFAVAHSLRRSNCSGPARSSDIVDQLWEPYVRPWNFFMRYREGENIRSSIGRADRAANFLSSWSAACRCQF